MLLVAPVGSPAGEISRLPVVTGGNALKVAVTVLFEFIETAQVLVPVHAPPQALNCEPGPALAVSITWVAAVKLLMHVAPQSTPCGSLLTTPEPVPFVVTLSEYVAGVCRLRANDCSGP
jgi:hypothetical protein